MSSESRNSKGNYPEGKKIIKSGVPHTSIVISGEIISGGKPANLSFQETSPPPFLYAQAAASDKDRPASESSKQITPFGQTEQNERIYTTTGTELKRPKEGQLEKEYGSEGKRLISAIKDKLMGEGIRFALHTKESYQDGIELFTNLATTEGTQFTLRINKRDPKKAEKNNLPDYFEMSWLNEKERSGGFMQFVEDTNARPGSCRGSVSKTLDDITIEAWNKKGGIHMIWSRGQWSPMTIADITRLTELLESAQPNQRGTDKIMRYLQREWGAIEIAAPDLSFLEHNLPQSSQKALPEN